MLKIKLEVDTDPPAGFETHIRYLLQPVPFAVRVYKLPDLFAGCRRSCFVNEILYITRKEFDKPGVAL